MRIQWGPRRASDRGGGHRELPLILSTPAGTRDIAVLAEGITDVEGHVGAQRWTYTTDAPAGDYTATDGEVTYVANKVAMKGSTGLILHMGNKTITCVPVGRGETRLLGRIAEGPSDVTPADEEIGAFNTAAGAVRQAVVELDEGHAVVDELSDAELTFLGFVTRASMERTLEKATFGWTILLLLLAPLLLWIFFFAGSV